MIVPPAEQVFEELLPYLEVLDSQIGGIVQLLKDKGITTTEEFAQYVQQADKASHVRSACGCAWNICSPALPSEALP